MRFESPTSLPHFAASIFLAVFALSTGNPCLSQAQKQKQTPAPAPAPAAAPASTAATPPPAPQKINAQSLDEDQILHHLNNVITWYRHVKTQIQPVGLPTDVVYQSNAERLAGDVVNSAFKSAESAAPLIPSEDAQGSTPSSRQSLLKLRADTAAHNAQLGTQIDQLSSSIASASKKNVKALSDQRDRLQGELDLGKAMLNSLDQLTNISEQRTQSGGKGQPAAITVNGFESSIVQLKNSLPEVFDAKTKSATAPQESTVNNPAGLIGKLRKIYDQSVSLREIDSLVLETNQLETFVNNVRAPLRAQLRATIDQGHALSASADNLQPGQPAPTKQDFDALAAKFDLIASVEVPLSQEIQALDESKANLTDWRDSIRHEYISNLHDVFIRVAVILGILGLLLLVSDLWKRMTFRYISDPRRRRQFLLMRRFVIGFFMGLVFILGFVSEFSALATFAGFITAGLAVGLQTILLSVAAYFFLIGRYGIRVGDRITIAGVTGDVVDVSIVRFYLLELAGTGIDLQPTGRIVAFSNAVLFQATSPMFRQVPGTDYTWHEIAISLNPGGNYEFVEQNMMEVIKSVYEKYQPILDRQQNTIEKRFEIPFMPLKPRAQLQLSDTGLEVVVRYPVGLRENVGADDEIARSLIDLIARKEDLRAAVSGLPKIRAAIRG
jgi:small-conductance mechanosensitive channel